MTSGLQFDENERATNYLIPNSSKNSESILTENDIRDIEDEEEEEDIEYLKNVFFRSGHEGCDEYTGITTFHGMIRMFNSRSNWPSLIFWCLVVTTCLVFYMIVCGLLLNSYSLQPTYLRFNKTLNFKEKPYIELCSIQKLSCKSILSQNNLLCKNASSNCIGLSFSFQTTLKTNHEDLYLKHGSESQKYYLISKPNLVHHFRLKPFQRNRLDLKRSPCFNQWKNVEWMMSNFSSHMNTSYSLSKCEKFRKKLIGIERNMKSKKCQPACSEIFFKLKYSQSFLNSKNNLTTISIFISPTKTYIDEIRKTTLIDILCYLGGTSSLFMGCSCITLMEIFVFLLKLLSSSICSSEPPELENDCREEQYLFESSNSKNKRRYAVFDQDSFKNCEAVFGADSRKSICLNKRLSISNKNRMKRSPKMQQLKESLNFQAIDVYDSDDKTFEEPTTSEKKQEFAATTKIQENEEEPTSPTRLLNNSENWWMRHPLRRSSTATSHLSHASRSSTSTVRTYYTVHPPRQYRRVFSKNMPMNDF